MSEKIAQIRSSMTEAEWANYEIQREIRDNLKRLQGSIETSTREIERLLTSIIKSKIISNWRP